MITLFQNPSYCTDLSRFGSRPLTKSKRMTQQGRGIGGLLHRLTGIDRLHQTGQPGTGAIDISDRYTKRVMPHKAIGNCSLHSDTERCSRLVIKRLVRQQGVALYAETGIEPATVVGAGYQGKAVCYCAPAVISTIKLPTCVPAASFSGTAISSSMVLYTGKVMLNRKTSVN